MERVSVEELPDVARELRDLVRLLAELVALVAWYIDADPSGPVASRRAA